MKKLILALAATVSLATAAACGSGIQSDPEGGENQSPEDISVVNVVKLTGVNWFDRMETGVTEFADASGIEASQTGADDASPEKQISIVSDLIPQQPDAITVVPNSPEALEAVLQRAQDAGIVVVTHEASSQENTDADIEPFDNDAYGAHLMDLMSDCMGGEGQYAHFVGQLTAETHVAWAEGALTQAESQYADISRVADPVISEENTEVAYQRTKELLARYPDLTGFIGSAATDVAGIGRAIEEAGLEDETCVVGTSIVSVAGDYLDSGAVDIISGWDPALAGKAMLEIATRLVAGEEIAEGDDLGVEGYESLTQSEDVPTTFFGDAWIDVDASNADEYDF